MIENTNVNHSLYDKKAKLCFERVYMETSVSILRYAKYLTRSTVISEDVVHDVFLFIWLRWPYLQELNSNKIKDYIFIATRNRIYNLNKANNRKRQKAKLYFNDAKEGYIHDDIIIKEGWQTFSRGLETLPSKRKRIFVLKYEGFKPREIANLLEISESTVRNQLRSSLKTVEQYLRNELDIAVDGDGRSYRYN